MNILFYTYGKVHSTKGGTERTTISVASGLTRNYGCKCFSLYEIQAGTKMEDCFTAEFQWTVTSNWADNISFIRKLVIENHIDFIVNQGTFIYVKHFKAAVKGLSCRIIFAHHFEPGWETRFMSFHQLLFHPGRMKSIIDFARWTKRLIFFPYQRMKYLRDLPKVYYEAYQYADRVILLSQEFIRQYQSFGRFNDSRKFSIIPNALSFNEYLPEEDLDKKRQIVLIVSRLDEKQKRLTLALAIWKRIKQHSAAKEWQLNIVGHGQDLKLYKHTIQKEGIPNVQLLGRQNPVPYYKEASIFFMTSKSEAWGLTLTEAQQFGVVPIAFNTYASLLDIITNGEDGIIITEGDIDAYVNNTLKLMQDSSMRKKIALQGILNCRRFAQDLVAEKWWQLFNDFGTNRFASL